MSTTLNSCRQFVAIFLFSSTCLFGCSGGVNLFAKSEDVKLGQQVQAEIAKNPKQYPILDNPTLRNYVQGIVNRIVSASTVKNKDFNYTVTLVRDDKTVNAFTLPGGPIYVYSGLMKYVDNEATLAGILAHEITHADHRHSTQQMTKQYGLEAVAQLALGNNSTLAGQIASGVAGVAENLTMLQFSRADETDADATSFNDLMNINGRPWYPGAIKYFMIKTLSGKSGRTSDLERLFLTHPPSQDRLDAINAQIRKANLPEPPESQLNSTQYQRFKSMLP